MTETKRPRDLADAKQRTQKVTSGALTISQVILFKDILDAGLQRKYFYASLSMIILSLSLQIVNGYLLLMIDQMTRDTKTFKKNNNCCAKWFNLRAFWCQCYQSTVLEHAKGRLKSISKRLVQLKYGSSEKQTETEGQCKNDEKNATEHFNQVVVHTDIQLIKNWKLKDEKTINRDEEDETEIKVLEVLKTTLEHDITDIEEGLVDRRLSMYYLTLSMLMYIVITTNVFITAFSVANTITGNAGNSDNYNGNNSTM